ncbi:hypothetical protein AB0F18_13400 [Streptomyces sp. NPDC029216]|uniref:hypothetical protein n=1 Tax=Streptomyces sp. NPDC029216 TaxID=3154701 RepID=UPI0033FC2B57
MKKTKALAMSLIAATAVLFGAGTASAGTLPISTLQPGSTCSSPGFGCPHDSGWQGITPPVAQ